MEQLLSKRLNKYKDIKEKIELVETQCDCLPIPRRKKWKILKQVNKLKRKLDKEYSDVLHALY